MCWADLFSPHSWLLDAGYSMCHSILSIIITLTSLFFRYEIREPQIGRYFICIWLSVHNSESLAVYLIVFVEKQGSIALLITKTLHNVDLFVFGGWDKWRYYVSDVLVIHIFYPLVVLAVSYLWTFLAVLNIYEKYHNTWLREKTLKELYNHICKDDEFTKCISIGPVSGSYYYNIKDICISWHVECILPASGVMIKENKYEIDKDIFYCHLTFCTVVYHKKPPYCVFPSQ